jgi:hypothetical protein
MAYLKELCAEYAALAALPAKSDPGELAAALQLRGRPELAAALTGVRQRVELVTTEGEVLEVARQAPLARRLAHRQKKLPPPQFSAHAAPRSPTPPQVP